MVINKFFLLAMFCTICSLSGFAQKLAEPFSDCANIEQWKLDGAIEKDLKQQAITYFFVGKCYTESQQQFDSAIVYFKKTLKNFIKLDAQRNMAVCYYYLGICYENINDKEKTIKNFVRANEIYTELKDTVGMINTSAAKGLSRPPKDGIPDVKKAAALASIIKFEGLELNTYGNIGNQFFELELYDSALYYYKKNNALLKDFRSESFDSTNKILSHSYNSHEQLGKIYAKKKEYKKAYLHLKKSYQYAKKIDAKYAGISSVAAEIIKLTYDWEKTNPKEYKKHAGDLNQIQLLREAQQISDNSSSYFASLAVAEGFVAYYKKVKNKDSLIHYQNTLLGLKDSMYKDEQIKATAKFSEELKTADKEKEIIKLNADKKIASATANRNKIIFFLILLGLLSSIYFIVKRIKYRNLKEQEERDKNFRSKLSSDLHDDVGTILTSLSMQSELLEIKASDDNKSSVGKIAKMSRDATRRMRDTVWAIDSRKDNIMDLAYRMIDFANDILDAKDVEFQLEHNIEGKDDKISAELRQNIFLIFKETITNAAKYGSGDLVTASLNKENDKLNLVVSNQTEAEINTAEASGLGLSNIKKRTTDLSGSFSMENKDNSFNIQLSFPL